MEELRNFWNEEDGLGTVELVLIIAALVALALLFRNRIISFITTALENVFGDQTMQGTHVS